MQRGWLRKEKIVASHTGNPDPQVACECVKACFSGFPIVMADMIDTTKNMDASYAQTRGIRSLTIRVILIFG